MKVILISGKAQHGKDTTAGFLKEALEAQGKKVLICHYGDLVKYICKTFFGWDGQKDEAGRSLLQRVGTDVIRRQCEDYWARFILEILGFFPNEWDYVLIPDCRFPNEVYLPRFVAFDTVHIRVIRPNFDNGLTPEQQAHPSETALDHERPNFMFENSGTLNDLKEIVRGWAENEIAFSRYLRRGGHPDPAGKRGAICSCPGCGGVEGIKWYPDTDTCECTICGWEG